jgi:hypothetical protein
MDYLIRSGILNSDITWTIEHYEPTSRTYCIWYKPSDITVWNKVAVNREIMYGTLVKNKNYRDPTYTIAINNPWPPYGPAGDARPVTGPRRGS